MSFDIDIGHASRPGPRERNEDFVGALPPAAHEESLGCVAAIADGVSTGGEGQLAAQTTVMALLQDYFAAPPTWHPTVAFDRIIGAQNAWLAAHNRRRKSGAALTTLTALALRGQSWTLAHVGDTRAYLVRSGDFQQLTQDHCLEHIDFKSGLTRAIGLEDSVRVDYDQGELRPGDSFVLLSDGVHGVLPQARIADLAMAGDAQAASEALVQAALAAGTRDNASALVLRVKGLAQGQLQDQVLRSRQLPIPARLKVGDTLDGFTVTALVADTSVHLLYQVRDVATRELWALKTLHPSRASDPAERAMLAHEAWLAGRVSERAEHGFVRVREPQSASAFYILYAWHSGQTLEQRLRDKAQPISVREVLDWAVAAARALGQLHRMGVVHRDVKPGNLHLGEDGRLRLLDLGVAVSGSEPVEQRSLHAGTPSYMNPEQWADEPVDPGSDLFALGVSLYQLLTGRLPFGEVEPFQVGRMKRDPLPPSRVRPDVPIWLDHIVLKAIAFEKRQRFETAEELLLALERGASRPLPAGGATPLLARSRVGLVKVALIVSLLFNLLLIYWLIFLPH
jgi:serine/threonine protein phosphatase PrpC